MSKTIDIVMLDKSVRSIDIDDVDCIEQTKVFGANKGYLWLNRCNEYERIPIRIGRKTQNIREIYVEFYNNDFSSWKVYEWSNIQ